jgi:AcrR family transcriptional regulator
MPKLLDVHSRTDALIVAAFRIICRDGLRGLTLRAVAAESRVSAAGIVHHFGGRERMDRVLARTFAHRWTEQIAGLARTQGAHAFLPADDEERQHFRVWLAWLELSRTEPSLAANLSGVRNEQRKILDWVSEWTHDEPGLDLLVAVVEGLASGLCAPGEPLSIPRARAALDRYLVLTSPA